MLFGPSSQYLHYVQLAFTGLNKKQAEKEALQDEETIDEEEYSLIKQLKDLKQEYRGAFEKNRQVSRFGGTADKRSRWWWA